MTFQEAVTPIAEQIHWFHDVVNVIIILITIFVMLLMLYVMWRFSEKRHPVPTKTTHNTTLEVLWTGFRCLCWLSLPFRPSSCCTRSTPFRRRI
jgi:heme/copper-type cytochrome/quinol oxidase subunit 2